MPAIDIVAFDITDRAEFKMLARGITDDHLYEVIERDYVIVPNRPNQPAPYVLIGRDAQGRCLAIPIAPTDDRIIWRPITAWECKPHEATLLRKRRSVMEEPVSFGASQEPFDDEERILMDPESWDWDRAEPGTPSPDAGAVLRIRFTRQEISRLQAIARAEGISSHEFIKRAALARAEQLTT
jgi:hypothetical protein